jgi:hypothetical protein
MTYYHPSGPGLCHSSVGQSIHPGIPPVPKQDKSNRLQAWRAIAGSLLHFLCIGSIGMTRGVPSEFKAHSQIATGFKSALFWWSTRNKNVGWINYIY